MARLVARWQAVQRRSNALERNLSYGGYGLFGSASAFTRRLLQFAGLPSVIGRSTDEVIPLSEISEEIFFISNCFLLACRFWTGRTLEVAEGAANRKKWASQRAA